MVPLRKLLDSPTRRDLLRLSAFGMLGGGSGWLQGVAGQALAAEQATRQPAKACIVLFMDGAPAQTYTFDMKPKTGAPGECPYKAIETSVPGIQIGEHLPNVSKQMHHLALVRSMSTAIADHGPARYLLRTGFRPTPGLVHPSMGARVASELVREDTGMPNYVLLKTGASGGVDATGAGFLPPSCRPLILRDVAAGLANLNPPNYIPGGMEGVRERTNLLQEVDQRFAEEYQSESARIKLQGYRKAVELMNLEQARTAFQVDKEPEKVQDLYGRTPFGRHCLGARRLLEFGVKYVEVIHPNNWDTHTNAVETVAKNSTILDQPMAALIADLKDRGMLDETLIVWMGEFGRDYTGSNHHANAWTTIFAGAGVRGGKTIGRTDAKGMAVEDRPVKVNDFTASVYTCLGMNPAKETLVRNRPIRLVDGDPNVLNELFS